MAHSSKKSIQEEAKTITWFEREILSHKSPHGILDEASIGIWSIIEQSGLLAGEWKNHRNLMHDLDTEKVSLALGTLLSAAVHTAHAVGISLESVMALQVERERVATNTRQQRGKESGQIPATTTARRRDIRTIGVHEVAPVTEQPIEPARRTGRPRKIPIAIEPIAIRDVPPPAPIDAPAVPKKRGRPAKQQEQRVPTSPSIPTVVEQPEQSHPSIPTATKQRKQSVPALPIAAKVTKEQDQSSPALPIVAKATKQQYQSIPVLPSVTKATKQQHQSSPALPSVATVAKPQEQSAITLPSAPKASKPQRKVSAPALFPPSLLADEHENNAQPQKPQQSLPEQPKPQLLISEEPKGKTQSRKSRNA